MNLDNFLVRPHRRWVETFSEWDNWATFTPEAAAGAVEHLAGLPSSVKDDDQDAKRFDLLILRRQLAQLQGDALGAERIREQVQNIAGGLLSQLAIPSVAAQRVLLDEVVGEEWWVDVTLPMLEVARLRLRGLVRFLETVRKMRVYTDFEDELGEAKVVDLPGVTPGTNWERFRAKAAAYLRQHEDHVTLQRLRRNKQLTADDLGALEGMLEASGGTKADIEWATEQTKGLGLFVRSLVGLDRQAAAEAFGAYLDQSRFSVTQIRFVNMIIDELTSNGVVEPRRLFESPCIDNAPTGPDFLFPEVDVEVIVGILDEVKAHAQPAEVA